MFQEFSERVFGKNIARNKQSSIIDVLDILLNDAV